MSQGAIRYNYQKSSFKLTSPRATSAWIQKVISAEGSTLDSLSYVFCTDKYLLSINEEFLHHSTYTDIMTFDYSEGSGSISGEIYISVDRVKENAKKFQVPFDTELHRVIIHGVLHLLGYGDKKPAQKTLMRKREEACLSLRSKSST